MMKIGEWHKAAAGRGANKVTYAQALLHMCQNGIGLPKLDGVVKCKKEQLQLAKHIEARKNNTNPSIMKEAGGILTQSDFNALDRSQVEAYAASMNGAVAKKKSTTATSSKTLSAKYTSTDGLLTQYGTFLPDKAPTKSGGGSRGGAIQTNYAESLQCYFIAAMVWGNSSNQPRSYFTKDVLKKHVSHVEATSSVDTIYANLGEDWFEVCHKIGKTVVDKLTAATIRKLKIYRDTGKMDEIGRLFKKAKDNHNKVQGIRWKFNSNNRNKWNPSDIYLIDPNIKFPNDITVHLPKLNAYFMEQFDNKKVIGISLKKLAGKTVNWTLLNKEPYPMQDFNKFYLFAKGYRDTWWKSSTIIDSKQGGMLNEFYRPIQSDAGTKLRIGARSGGTNNGGYTADLKYDLISNYNLNFEPYSKIKGYCQDMMKDPHGKRFEELYRVASKHNAFAIEKERFRADISKVKTDRDFKIFSNTVWDIYFIDTLINNKDKGQSIMNNLYQMSQGTSKLSSVHYKAS